MSTEDKDTLLDLSVLTNDDSGELDPAVLAPFKAYEKSHCNPHSSGEKPWHSESTIRTAQLERVGLPTSTAADTSTSTGSSIAQSNVSSTGSNYPPHRSHTEHFALRAPAPIGRELPTHKLLILKHRLSSSTRTHCLQSSNLALLRSARHLLAPLHQVRVLLHTLSTQLRRLDTISQKCILPTTTCRASVIPLRESILFSRTCPPFGQHDPQLWFDMVD
ncbi:unnamed protein product, partial [Trichogramma brassicae]